MSQRARLRRERLRKEKGPGGVCSPGPHVSKLIRDQWQPKQVLFHFGVTFSVPFAWNAAHELTLPFGPQFVAVLSPVATPPELTASRWQSSHWFPPP